MSFTSNPQAGDTYTYNGTVLGTGIQISDMIVWKLSRIGGNGADTYGADARLLEFDIHYQQDAPGSIAQFTK